VSAAGGGGDERARGGRGSIWRTVKAVAWGFFGVRKDSAYQKTSPGSRRCTSWWWAWWR